MYKKNLLLVTLIVFCLGLFFQGNRLDALLHLFKNKNPEAETKTMIIMPDDAQNLPDERFLIVYDDKSVYSTFFKHKLQNHLEKYMKKSVDIITADDDFKGGPYSAVLWIAPGFANQKLWSEVKQYAENGGTLEVLTTENVLNYRSDFEYLGMANTENYTSTLGIVSMSSLMLGAEDFQTGSDAVGYTTYALSCSLQPDVQLYLKSADKGIPLAWAKSQGSGKIIVYNGSDLYAKKNIGVLTALLSQSHEDFLFPVCATKTMFIDDFPSPVPAGDFPKIYDEYKLSTADFYERIWWPYMLETAKKFNLKYTGAAIETYNDKVTGDFSLNDNNARRVLIKYGRELVNSGGELGIHGYNHQSLAGDNFGLEYLGYKSWHSQADMESSLRELKSYIDDVFPGYAVHAYVPPSNVLSPEGKAAVKKVFPALQAYSSLYSGSYDEEKVYIQNFGRNEDGTYEFPRITSGYDPNETMYFDAVNCLNAYGIFSHFVHPDEIFYKTTGDKTPSELEESFTAFMSYISDRYSWLRSSTLSNTLKYFGDYLDMQYRYKTEDNLLTIYTWNYLYEPAYILRSKKKVKNFEGCDITKIQRDAYFIKIKNSKAVIVFDGAQK